MVEALHDSGDRTSSKYLIPSYFKIIDFQVYITGII